jgi:hypothetical protein
VPYYKIEGRRYFAQSVDTIGYTEAEDTADARDAYTESELDFETPSMDDWPAGDECDVIVEDITEIDEEEYRAVSPRKADG